MWKSVVKLQHAIIDVNFQSAIAYPWTSHFLDQRIHSFKLHSNSIVVFDLCPACNFKYIVTTYSRIDTCNLFFVFETFIAVAPSTRKGNLASNDLYGEFHSAIFTEIAYDLGAFEVNVVNVKVDEGNREHRTGFADRAGEMQFDFAASKFSVKTNTAVTEIDRNGFRIGGIIRGNSDRTA